MNVDTPRTGISGECVFVWNPQNESCENMIAVGQSSRDNRDGGCEFSCSSKLEIFEVITGEDGATKKEWASVGNLTSRLNRISWTNTQDSYLGFCAAGMEDGRLWIWDVSKLKLNSIKESVVYSGHRHKNSIRGLDFNPIHRNLLASGGGVSELFISDIVDPSKTYGMRPKSGGNKDLDSRLNCLKWNHMTSNILAYNECKNLVVFDVREGKEIMHFELPQTSGGFAGIKSIAWDQTSPVSIFTSSISREDPSLYYWDLRNSSMPCKVFNEECVDAYGQIDMISINDKDPAFILTTSIYGRCVLWNLKLEGSNYMDTLREFPSNSNGEDIHQALWSRNNPDLIAFQGVDKNNGFDVMSYSSHVIKSKNKRLCSNLPPWFAHSKGEMLNFNIRDDDLASSESNIVLSRVKDSGFLEGLDFDLEGKIDLDSITMDSKFDLNDFVFLLRKTDGDVDKATLYEILRKWNGMNEKVSSSENKNQIFSKKESGILERSLIEGKYTIVIDMLNQKKMWLDSMSLIVLSTMCESINPHLVEVVTSYLSSFSGSEPKHISVMKAIFTKNPLQAIEGFETEDEFNLLMEIILLNPSINRFGEGNINEQQEWIRLVSKLEGVAIRNGFVDKSLVCSAITGNYKNLMENWFGSRLPEDYNELEKSARFIKAWEILKAFHGWECLNLEHVDKIKVKNFFEMSFSFFEVLVRHDHALKAYELIEWWLNNDHVLNDDKLLKPLFRLILSAFSKVKDEHKIRRVEGWYVSINDRFECLSHDYGLEDLKDVHLIKISDNKELRSPLYIGGKCEKYEGDDFNSSYIAPPGIGNEGYSLFESLLNSTENKQPGWSLGQETNLYPPGYQRYANYNDNSFNNTEMVPSEIPSSSKHGGSVSAYDKVYNGNNPSSLSSRLSPPVEGYVYEMSQNRRYTVAEQNVIHPSVVENNGYSGSTSESYISNSYSRGVSSPHEEIFTGYDGKASHSVGSGYMHQKHFGKGGSSLTDVQEMEKMEESNTDYRKSSFSPPSDMFNIVQSKQNEVQEKESSGRRYIAPGLEDMPMYNTGQPPYSSRGLTSSYMGGEVQYEAIPESNTNHLGKYNDDHGHPPFNRFQEGLGVSSSISQERPKEQYGSGFSPSQGMFGPPPSIKPYTGSSPREGTVNDYSRSCEKERRLAFPSSSHGFVQPSTHGNSGKNDIDPALIDVQYEHSDDKTWQKTPCEDHPSRPSRGVSTQGVGSVDGPNQPLPPYVVSDNVPKPHGHKQNSRKTVEYKDRKSASDMITSVLTDTMAYCKANGSSIQRKLLENSKDKFESLLRDINSGDDKKVSDDILGKFYNIALAIQNKEYDRCKEIQNELSSSYLIQTGNVNIAIKRMVDTLISLSERSSQRE